MTLIIGATGKMSPESICGCPLPILKKKIPEHAAVSPGKTQKNLTLPVREKKGSMSFAPLALLVWPIYLCPMPSQFIKVRLNSSSCSLQSPLAIPCHASLLPARQPARPTAPDLLVLAPSLWSQIPASI